jgi:hypothetical protein
VRRGAEEQGNKQAASAGLRAAAVKADITTELDLAMSRLDTFVRFRSKRSSR